MGAGGAIVGVDTGGTFTDVFTSDGHVIKVPSTPDDPARAILTALGFAGMRPGDVVAHGTTVATNAVLERKGARTVLITTAGFEDVLEIRRQNRPSLYDLLARWPEPLVPAALRLGAVERLDFTGAVVLPLGRECAEALVARAAELGPEAVAICLLFSYANPIHEQLLAQALSEKLPENTMVSLSHEVAPQYGEFERTSTTVLNAYIGPVMKMYLHRLLKALESQEVGQLHIMLSSGGLSDVSTATRRPLQTVLSGPAGGVVGAHAIARAAGRDRIITFDMGGTSTDVAVVPGTPAEIEEGELSGFPLLTPMLLIETIGAGGGSIARVDAGGGLHVGPESAGADPGPAAYGRGTLPTVTDANLILGRVSPGGLLGGAMPLDLERARFALTPLADRLGLSVSQAAWAVIRLANSNMDRAVRAVTLQRGHDPRTFSLFAFGGAGPLHAAEMSESLGIGDILIPPHPGVMAALGLTVPDLRRDYRRTVLLPVSRDALARAEDVFSELELHALEELRQEELFGEPRMERLAFMRYAGQSFYLAVGWREREDEMLHGFEDTYRARHGRLPSGERHAEIVHLGLRATSPRLRVPQLVPEWPEPARGIETRQVWFGSPTGIRDLTSHSAQVFWRPSLLTGTSIPGPAVLEQYDSCVVVPPDWTADVDDAFNLALRRRA